MQLLVESLLHKYQIPYDRSEIQFQMESHPSYPSLHAVTGVLDHFDITNVAARIPKTNESLNQIPDFFIAQLKSAEFDGLFFVEKQQEDCSLLGVDGASKKISQDDFLHAFTGILLAVEKSENQEKESNTGALASYLTFGVLALVLGYLFISSMVTFLQPLLLLTALVGLVIGVSIMQQELGIKNKIGEALCDGTSTNNNCNAVLNAESARLFGAYKLSDLSLVYFVGYTLTTFCLTVQGQSLDVLLIIAALSLPVTVYSVYYQAFKIKSWCFLCLGIVMILWGQAISIFWYYSFAWQLEFSVSATLITVTGFIISISFWVYIRPGILEAELNKRHKTSFYKFKRNYNIFQFLLKDQPPVDTYISGLEDMVYGNPDARLELLFVTNPLCGHCKPVHSIIEKILLRFSEDVRLVIRFNIGRSNVENDPFLIAANLRQIYQEKGKEESSMAMHEAYLDLNEKDWIDKWITKDKNNSVQRDQLNLQANWCVENKINFTPVILINGYAFPKEYERADLLFFIEELLEESNQSTVEQVAAVL